MHYERPMAFAAISDAWLPDRPRSAVLPPRPQRGGARLFPVLRAHAARLLRKGPKR
jgi:hypothetical protein